MFSHRKSLMIYSLKRFKAGGNVTVTSDSNNVIISSVGGLQSLIVATDSGNITLSEGETFTIAGGNNVTTQVNGANGISINAATELSTDLTPQLGANLDGQNRDILNVRNIESLVHMVDVRDIYGFNFGTITGSTSSIIEFLGSSVDINLGTISQPGLQDDSTIDDLSIDVGTITNPL